MPQYNEVCGSSYVEHHLNLKAKKISTIVILAIKHN